MTQSSTNEELDITRLVFVRENDGVLRSWFVLVCDIAVGQNHLACYVCFMWESYAGDSRYRPDECIMSLHFR